MKRSRPRRLRPRRSVPVAASAMALLALARPTTATAQSLTITDAVSAALDVHPTVAAATARVEAAEGAGDAARAARLPGASVEGTLTRFQEPMIVAPFHSLDFSSPPTFDRTLVQGRLALAYTVFDGGGRSARIRGADAMEEASTYGLSAAEMTVIEETASAYVGVLAAQAGLDAANAQVSALQEEADRAQRQLDAGTAPEVEVLRARASLQDARARQASAEARVGLAVRALARQMSVDPETISPLSLSDVTAAPGTTLPSGSRDVSASPVVQRADRAALAARARVSEERAGRLPTVQAGAGVLDYGTLDDDHVLEWQAGLQVSWPLFTGGARSASVRRAEAELAAARNELEATRLQVAQTVDAAETAVVEADARAEALELAVTQWEEVSRIEALALEAGSGVQADRLRAEAGLYQARAGYAQARYDAVLSRIRLARAAGTLDLNWMAAALEASR